MILYAYNVAASPRPEIRPALSRPGRQPSPQDIQAGRLKAGDRLPPQRDLADRARRHRHDRHPRLHRGRAPRAGARRGGPRARSSARRPSRVPHDQAAGLIDLGTNALLPHAHAGELTAALAALVVAHRARAAVQLPAARAAGPSIAASPPRTCDARACRPKPADTILTSGAQHAMAVALATLTAPGDISAV